MPEQITLYLEGFRFPTTKELQSTQQLVVEGSKPNNYKLKNTYFPDNATLAHEIEMWATKEDSLGMTFVHALGTEPRLFTKSGAQAMKTSWTGAYFKEAARWGEVEIIKLGELKEDVRTSRIKEEVASVLIEMNERLDRRLEWLAAQIMTKGYIEFTPGSAYNPEGVAFKAEYRIKDDTITLAANDKWDNLDVDGNNTADPVKFFHDLEIANLDDVDNRGRYQVQKLLMNTKTYRALAANTKIIERYRLTLGGGYLNPIDPISILPAFPGIFKQLTGLDIEIYDEGYLDENKVFQKFIPDGHVTLIYGGPSKFGEFTYTAHAHAQGGNLTVGTGRFVLADDQTAKAVPYYEIFSGFHGLPRLMDYDYNLECQRLKFVQVLT